MSEEEENVWNDCDLSYEGEGEEDIEDEEDEDDEMEG